MQQLIKPHMKPNILKNEAGFASLVIGLVIVLVLGLLSVAFAQLARREQQNALAKQLSTQAYYAAESGINDVVHNLASIIATPPSPSSCYIQNRSISTSTGTYESCVMVSTKLDALEYQPSDRESKSAVFSAVGGGALSKLTVHWSSVAGNTTWRTGGACDFSPAASSPPSPANDWQSPAVVQFSITPFDPGHINRDDLTNGTYTAFLYPSNSACGGVGGSIGYSNPAGDAPLVSGMCTDAGGCNVTITGISAPAGANTQYLIHFLNLYDASNLTLQNATDNSGNPLSFEGAQVQIDSTGKARNVLKRVQVHYALNGSEASPYAVEAQSICKRFMVYPGSYTPDTSAYGGGATNVCDVTQDP